MTNNKGRSKVLNCMFWGMFIFYLFMALDILFLRSGLNNSSINLIPFKSISEGINVYDGIRYKLVSPQVWGNVLMFVPAGVYMMIFNKKDCISDTVSAGMKTVGVRFPKSEIARAIIKESGTLLVAPSANLSGKPSTTSAEHCYNDLNGKIPCILDGGPCLIGLESTIIDMSTPDPVLLRPGAISLDDIRKVIPNLIYKKNLLSVKGNEIPKAPGMKYRHYAPDAPVTLVKGDYAKTSKWIKENANEDNAVICFQEFLKDFKNYEHVYSLGSFKTLNVAAQKTFDLLRECDKLNVSHIYVQAPKDSGLGNSIINRLEKASAGDVINI